MRQVFLCQLVTLTGGETKALGGSVIIQGNALAVQIEIAEVELGVAISLPGRTVEPFCGFSIVLGNALARGIAHPKVDLSADMPLIGGFSIPSHGFGLVKRKAIPCCEAATDAKLGICVSTISVSL